MDAPLLKIFYSHSLGLDITYLLFNLYSCTSEIIYKSNYIENTHVSLKGNVELLILLIDYKFHFIKCSQGIPRNSQRRVRGKMEKSSQSKLNVFFLFCSSRLLRKS